jgi:hypothetical protein
MKYVCYKQLITKIVDQEITDLEDTKAILKVICDHELTCSMQIKDVHGLLSYKKVRIREMQEDSFKYITYTSTSTLKREAKYIDIVHLEMITVDAILAVLKPKINRWNLLEAEDFED